MRWKQGRWTLRVLMASLLAGVCAHNAAAQISLSAAVDLALRNDPKVKAAAADVDKARAALSEANAAYVPAISMNGGYGAATGVPLSLPVVFSMSGQSLLFNFSQHDNLRAAAAGVSAAKLALDGVRDKVAEDVAVTYIDLDNAEQREAAKQKAYGYASRLVTIVNDRLAAGQDTTMQLLEARHTAALMHQDQVHGDEEVATLAEHLLLVVGMPGDHIETIPASVPAMPDLSATAAVGGDSYEIQSAQANARSKQELAFGMERYPLRPQIGFGANYSRITTTHTSYTTYYPAFLNRHSDNALSVGLQITIPLLDRAHAARARQSEADAVHEREMAEDARNQFREGRFKLQHSLEELRAGIEVAQTASDLAMARREAVVEQLNASSSDPDRPQMTPKDEQNARLEESEREIDVLNSELQLQQAEVNLMRQTGQLDGWIKTAVAASAFVGTGSAKP